MVEWFAQSSSAYTKRKHNHGNKIGVVANIARVLLASFIIESAIIYMLSLLFV